MFLNNDLKIIHASGRHKIPKILNLLKNLHLDYVKQPRLKAIPQK